MNKYKQTFRQYVRNMAPAMRVILVLGFFSIIGNIILILTASRVEAYSIEIIKLEEKDMPNAKNGATLLGQTQNYDGEDVRIVLNASYPSPIVEETLAHELAHLVQIREMVPKETKRFMGAFQRNKGKECYSDYGKRNFQECFAELSIPILFYPENRTDEMYKYAHYLIDKYMETVLTKIK